MANLPPTKPTTGTKRPRSLLLEIKKEVDSSNAEDTIMNLMKILDDIHSHRRYAFPWDGSGYAHEIYYMLIPLDANIKTCETINVGRGSKYYKVDDASIVAGVYVLAKNQYQLAAKGSEGDAIKWAVLRTEMFLSGWFDNQTHCKYLPTPGNFSEIFTADAEKRKSHFQSASKLCTFVPFMNEFYFRTTGSHYTSHTAAEFMVKAGKFAEISGLGDAMKYMGAGIIFGPAFRWVGVKRPRDVLIANLDEPNRVLEVFRVRAKYGPAGQAFLTSSYAVIKALQADQWWEPICRVKGYKDDALIKVAEKILEQPWKYHMFSVGQYGESPLSDDELKEIETAKDVAILFSPTAQAYCDVMKNKSALGNIKTIKRHASNLPSFLYDRAVDLFKDLSRRKRSNKPIDDQIFAKHL